MASPRRIRVMISSTNRDKLEDGHTMTEVREELVREIESIQLFGDQLFDVWINEEGAAAAAIDDSWDHCMAQARRADILLVLYNGNAGWTKAGGEVGICHAELQQAVETAPGKVRLIRVDPLVAGTDPDRDARFQHYVQQQTPFWKSASTKDAVKEAAKTALRDAVGEMVGWGGREARRGKYHTGSALDWARLDFASRKNALENTLADAMEERGGRSASDGIEVSVAGTEVLFLCHGIPSAMGTAAGREMVGQPHLREHRIQWSRSDIAGPVHLVACHRGITEAQAVSILGFPDATVVAAPFGVYVADDVQKIQLVFLKDCRDDTSTRHGLQRLFEWLGQAREDSLLAARAKARRRIVDAVVQELAPR